MRFPIWRVGACLGILPGIAAWGHPGHPHGDGGTQNEEREPMAKRAERIRTINVEPRVILAAQKPRHAGRRGFTRAAPGVVDQDSAGGTGLQPPQEP